MELIKILKALADENRIRILNLLRQDGLCVCEVEHVLEMTQSNASRHLTKLSDVGLITYTKKAQWVCYQLNEELMAKYPFLRELILSDFAKVEQCRKDLEKLDGYQESGTTRETLRVKGGCSERE